MTPEQILIAELKELQGIQEPWAQLQRALIYLTLQWKPLQDKWFNDREHWTKDDNYLFLHYHAACCAWPDLFPR